MRDYHSRNPGGSAGKSGRLEAVRARKSLWRQIDQIIELICSGSLPEAERQLLGHRWMQDLDLSSLPSPLIYSVMFRSVLAEHALTVSPPDTEQAVKELHAAQGFLSDNPPD